MHFQVLQEHAFVNCKSTTNTRNNKTQAICYLSGLLGLNSRRFVHPIVFLVGVHDFLPLGVSLDLRTNVSKNDYFACQYGIGHYA